MNRFLLTLSFVVGCTALAQGRLTINGRALSQRDQQIVAALERQAGQKSVPGDYWYDNLTGALGKWGGPTLMFLSPGLGLGGPLPANASGGGNGMLTGVFINGRELHPVDVQGLTALMRVPVQQGRWWVDAQGNCGQEGGPPMFNIYALSRQNGGGGDLRYSDRGNGKSTTIGRGCAAVHGSSGSGESKVDHSYYVGCD